MPGSTTMYPTGKKQILDWFYEDTDEESRIKSYCFVNCKICNEYVVSELNVKPKCSNCLEDINLIEGEFFVFFDIVSQLKNSIRRNWSVVKSYDVFNDQKCFFNGTAFKEVKSKLTNDEIALPLTINTDGAKVWNTNTKSLWPILMTQTYLEPKECFKRKNMILAAIYYGGKQNLDFDLLFYPVIEQLVRLRQEHIEIDKNDRKYIFVPVVLNCVADLPAKAAVQKLKQFNGKKACSFCLHPGKKVKLKNTTVRRYTDGKYTERNHSDTYEHMKLAESRNRVVNGLKGKIF